jgi:hypothetical protein
MPEIAGGGGRTTVKLDGLTDDPPGPSTETNPVVAPCGTTAVIWVPESTVKLALVPLNQTFVAPVNPEPVIAMEAPTIPDAGATAPITGGGGSTVNDAL